jgi:dTDP-4-amino-4,6-dideoxygalactose transaminase
MSKKASKDVKKVLDSGFIGQGPKVEEFEDLLQKELKSSIRPVTVNSCTNAIQLALHLIGVRPDDEVISTPQTCFASQIGILQNRAAIKWADIDPASGLIDPVSVEKLITDKTKAIVAVNWAGKFADYEKLKSFGIPVIEDAAHTWDVYEHEKARGDYICYSLQAIKFLTASDGGVLITPKEQEHRARLLRWFGLDRTKGQSFRCAQNIEEAGFKYHMNDVCAAIGIANIPEARDSVFTNRRIAQRYCNAFKNLKNVKVLPFDNTSSYWLYSMIVENTTASKFTEYMTSKGIEVSPVHYRNDLYSCVSDYKIGDLHGVDTFTEKQINIPIGWWLTRKEIAEIIKCVTDFDSL